jgi:hypothetical protein
MSLINDALKRATRATRMKPRKPAEISDGSAILPTFDKRSNGAGVLPILIVVLVVIGLGYGGWVWWQKKSAPPAVATTVKPKPKSTADGKSMVDAKTRGATNNPIARSRATLEKVQDQNHQGERVADTMKANPTPTKVASAGSQGAPAAPQVATSTPQVTSATQEATTPQAAPTAPESQQVAHATPANLRLQAVFFRLKKPSAIINGKTVYEGDDVEGAHVVKIERRSVNVQQDGSVRTLSLN